MTLCVRKKKSVARFIRAFLFPTAPGALKNTNQPVVDGQFCNELLICDIKTKEHVSMTILRTKFLLFSVYLWYIVTYACET